MDTGVKFEIVPKRFKFDPFITLEMNNEKHKREEAIFSFLKRSEGDWKIWRIGARANQE
jgi:hypothetical protein